MDEPKRVNRRLVLGVAGAVAVFGGLSRRHVAVAARNAAATPASEPVPSKFTPSAVAYAPAGTVHELACGLRRRGGDLRGSLYGRPVQGGLLAGRSHCQIVRTAGVATLAPQRCLRADEGSLMYGAALGVLTGPAALPDAAVDVRIVTAFVAAGAQQRWFDDTFIGARGDARQFGAGCVARLVRSAI